MSFKIAASDFDGTLFRNRQISEEDLTAIKNWRSAGNKFGIVSGRAYTMLPSHFQKFNLKLDFAICDNGAIIYDGDEKIVYETELPKEILFEIIKEPFAEESLHVAFETSETVYCTSIKPASWLLREKEGWQSPLIMIEVAQIASLSKINQMALAFQSPEEAFAAAEKLNQKFGEYIFAQKNTHSVDIVVAGVNKGSGVENLLRVNNWSGKAYVIGDESNDLPMIRKFGGYTVSTAKDFVKHEATKVFDSVGAMLNNYCF